jgi:hypothetical protein
MLHARERLADRSRSLGDRARLAPEVVDGDLAFALHDDHVTALVLGEGRTQRQEQRGRGREDGIGSHGLHSAFPGFQAAGCQHCALEATPFTGR